MTDIKEDRENAVVELTVDDEYIDESTFEEITKRITDVIEECGSINIIEHVEQFPNFDPALLWEDLKFSLKNLDNIDRCAVVSDRGWVGPYARILGVLVPCEVRVFKTGEEENARSWIRSD